MPTWNAERNTPEKAPLFLGELPEGLRGRLRGFKYSETEEQAGMQ